MTTEDGIGVRVRRREDRRFLTGRGRYVHDIVRPRQLHAIFLRSPHAHAEILGIDKTEAQASHGVAAIFIGTDVAADKLNGVPCAWGIIGKDGAPMKEPRHPLLAQGKVRHVGDPVAMVIADSVEAARNAAERIAVDYRILPAEGFGASDGISVETFPRSGALSISTVPRAETALTVVIIRAGLGGHISTKSAFSPNLSSYYSRLFACRSTAATCDGRQVRRYVADLNVSRTLSECGRPSWSSMI